MKLPVCKKFLNIISQMYILQTFCTVHHTTNSLAEEFRRIQNAERIMMANGRMTEPR